MNKGATIKTVIIGAVLAFCIAGVWMASSKETVAEGKAVVSTETAESVQEDIVIDNPVHFWKTVPAWNKYDGIEVTGFDEGRVDESDNSEEVQYVSVQDGIGTVINGGDSEPIGGDSTPTEGTEYADEATEYNDAAQEIPVEEYVEEPVEEIPAPEESTFVEEPVAEPEPIVEEPVAEEPAVEEPTEPQMEHLGTWTISFYCPAECCCGQWAYGPTASGVMPTAWHTVATSGLEFGTQLYVDGLGYFVVEDRGTEYGWLDCFVNDHSEAVALGLQYRDVYIVR